MTDNRNRDFETPRVLHDAPLRTTDQHHFHFDQFAVTLARLIADKTTRTPLTIGVSGPWGSGKTTLLQRTRKMLDDAGNLSDVSTIKFVNAHDEPQKMFRPCKTVWFDAWKYSQENQLLAALIRVILATMATGNLGEKFWSKVLDKSYPRRDVIATFLSFFSLKTDAVDVSFDIDKFKTETPFALNTAFLDFFDDALEELLARWVHGEGDYHKIDESKGALAVFIDDLDRCLPDKTVQVLEAIKLFMDKPGCVFVLGADTSVVRDAVIRHYQAAGFTEQSAGDYLEKIVQMRFELPPIPDQQMQRYLDVEAKGVLDDEVRRNWSVLVIGAGNNPRKVKTFANDLNLRWAMLKNSGEAEGVNRDDFTRWQVLMRVAPGNFVKQLNNIDDQELRHKFILDALKWTQGDQGAEATFRDYVGALELRRVLREIKAFSDQFTPKALDAFVHLTAPPQPALTPEVKPEAKPEITVKEPAELEEAIAFDKGVVTREAKALAANVQTWGGVEFVRVPAGKFLMGSKDDNKLAFDDEKPQHTVEIPYDYWMARYPVTNALFAAFVEAADKAKLDKNWKKKADHPVVNVSWTEAMAYCTWLNERLHGEIGDMTMRLPTEAEWEKAARGEYGNEWPWGNEFDAGKCNSAEGGKKRTTPVGAYSPQGDSPYGVADMAGNVWEWCHTLYKPYPYKADIDHEDDSASGTRVLRGGTFSNSQRLVRCASRDGYVPDARLDLLGFRVVVSPGFM